LRSNVRTNSSGSNGLHRYELPQLIEQAYAALVAQAKVDECDTGDGTFGDGPGGCGIMCEYYVISTTFQVLRLRIRKIYIVVDQ
jgi:hypothetical protein